MSNVTFYDSERYKEELNKRQLMRIKKLYKDTAKDFAKEIKTLESKDNISSILKTQYIHEYKRDLEKEVTKINNEIEGMIKASVEGMSTKIVNDNNKYLHKFGMKNIKGAYSYIPRESVDKIISGKLYEGRWTLSSAIWTDNKKQITEIENIVAKGMVQNQSAYEIAKALEIYVTPDRVKPWDWGKVYPGSRKVIDYNAARLSRTMVSHAYQETLVRVTENNPFIDGYLWRTAGLHTCELCQEREGTIYKKDEVPLDHPNGMCYLSLVQTKSNDEIVNDIANWYNNVGDPEMNRRLDMFAKDLFKK